MLMNINKSLAGVPIDLVTALAGQANPNAVDGQALLGREEVRFQRRFGAALSCFISAYKSFGSKS